MTDRPWKFVLAGCGRMGLAHARRLMADSRAELIGLFDTERDAAARLQQQQVPSATVCRSFEQLLEAGADAVVIATPTSCHHDQIVCALQTGAHVLAEKPLAAQRTEIAALVELSAAFPAQHGVLGYQRRFWNNYRLLHEQVASGEYGRIQAVTLITGESWEVGIAGTWRDTPDGNWGGFLGDAGSHKIDALMYVTGLVPSQVTAVTANSHSAVPVVTSVTGWLTDHVPLTMAFTGNAHAYHEELLIHCEQADLILRDRRVQIAQDNQYTELKSVPAESGPESTCNPVSGFLDLLEGDDDNRAPFACALPVYDVTAAILESSQSGRSAIPGQPV